MKTEKKPFWKKIMPTIMSDEKILDKPHTGPKVKPKRFFGFKLKF